MSDQSPLPAAQEEQRRDWYDANADTFVDAVAIELPFVGLDKEAQARLHRFKWYALTDDRLIEWRDRDVLEFGAGHGRFAVQMPGYRSYTGVDYSKNLVAHGRARLAALGLQDKARLELADCMSYDGPPAAFDVVCCLGTLPYLEDLDGIIRKMAHHAKPGGTVVADFRHATPLFSLMRQIKWRIGTQTGGTSRAHSKWQLRRAMQAAGLTDVKFVMREYPFLPEWYAEKKRDFALNVRQALCRRSWLDWLAMTGFAAARKPA